MKLAPASLAMAFANIVFPVPGGPNSNIPLHGFKRPPLNRSGLRIGSITSCWRDSLISSKAPISLNVTPISLAGMTSGLVRFSNSLSGGISRAFDAGAELPASFNVEADASVKADASRTVLPTFVSGFTATASSFGVS
ncbi:uncharacterized protein LOC114309576 [Camellia sinensis]|uniref:uncharacterized protein LOC114309576 n=1 Tax=Camellia sinensis TaxID=4442 RepID=UPI001035C10E|nr:uncharacterized protein LOC114309576 [Camellia sinensis]